MIKPPVSRVGGKFLLRVEIVKRIPKHKLYCEAFCGASWVLFAKERSEIEVINDIDSELINFFQIVRVNPKGIISLLNYELYSRRRFEDLLSFNPRNLTKVERAARFFYISKTSFAAKGENFGTSKTQPAKFDFMKVKELIDMAYERLRRVTIECQDYSRIINRYDTKTTLFYLDPPYRKCRGSEAYNRKFFDKDYLSLKSRLNNIEGRFILSLNDDPFVRRVFSNFNIESVKTSYSLNQQKHVAGNELIISNF